jgi:hypothetical protein
VPPSWASRASVFNCHDLFGEQSALVFRAATFLAIGHTSDPPQPSERNIWSLRFLAWGKDSRNIRHSQMSTHRAAGDWPAQHIEFILVQNRTIRH